MRRRLLVTIVALAGACLATGAVPAFTADNGTVTVTITAQPAAAPCITVAPTTLDFGTLPFSTSGALSTRFIGQAGTTPTVANCGTAGQTLTIATTNANGPSGSWAPAGGAYDANPCPAVDTFNLTAHLDTSANDYTRVTNVPVPVIAAGGVGSHVQPAGGSDLFGFTLNMPCQGSNGAGEQKALTLTFTAVIA